MAPGREPDQQDHGVRQFPSRVIRQQQQLCGYGYYSNATINSTGLAYLDTASSNSNFGTILLIAQDTTAASEFFSWTLNTNNDNEDLRRDSCRLNCRRPASSGWCSPCRLPLRRPAPWGLSTGNENDAVGAAVSQNNTMAVRSRELSWSRPHA